MSDNPFRDDNNPYRNDNPYADSSSAAHVPPPTGPGSDPAIEKEIKSQAMTSLVVGILSFFCFGIILAPFAIYRGSKAKKLIETHNMGHEHRGIAQAGTIIGWISLVLAILTILFFALAPMFGNI